MPSETVVNADDVIAEEARILAAPVVVIPPVVVKPKKKRPAVSLSMAGHCRMEIWLKAQGREEEAPTALVQRKFDFGHMIEAAVFDTVPLGKGTSAESVGPWYKSLGTVTDFSTGEEYDTKALEIQHRQEVVEDENGIKGHLDGLGGPDPVMVEDSKSMPSYSWTRNIKDDLLGNVFSREMVMQQNQYVRWAAKKFPSLGITKWRLWMVNRDDTKIAVRTGAMDPVLVDEGQERLSWGRSKAEPTPDYEWTKGQPLPLRCSYCGVKAACAEVRGTPITFAVEKNKPVWRVA